MRSSDLHVQAWDHLTDPGTHISHAPILWDQSSPEGNPQFPSDSHHHRSTLFS